LGGFGKTASWKIGGRKQTDTSNNDLLALLVPLERGTGADAELPPDSGGNRNLALRRQA
jgi:hypothetical protein